jgi:glycosyltransferase involved in cell wall biosynthesis
MAFEISVAIPAYNRADYLKETLESVFNQTFPPSEIFVVDDGSTDNTQDVITSYGSRIRSLRIENSGAGIARKIAAESTNCPWLAFCDSDDIWLPHHLERRVDLLKRNPDINFSFSNLQPFGPASHPNQTYFSDAPSNWWKQFKNRHDNYIYMGNDAYKPFLTYNPGSPVTTVMTRELYDSIGGIDPRYSRMVAEDADMARKAVLHGNVLCDLTITAKQRRHLGNMSAQTLHNLLGKIRILQDHLDLGIAPSELHKDICQAIENTYQDAFLAAYYADAKQEIQQIIEKLGFFNLSFKDKLRYLLIQAKHMKI